MPRTLPIRAQLHTGESFASYAARLAAEAEVGTLTMLARTGVVDADLYSHAPAGYGVYLPPECGLSPQPRAYQRRGSPVRSLPTTTG